MFEHAPWVAEAAAAGRPYPTVTALHDAMMQAVRQAAPERQLAFIGGHPELGSRVKRADLTDHSQSEQGGLGLDRLSAEEFDRFNRLNAAYREKFGFPFIVCVRRHTRDSILRQFERRLAHDAEAEREAALHEIGLITRLRLVALVDGPGMPVTTGRLSTHVLDTVTGRPAPGVRIALARDRRQRPRAAQGSRHQRRRPHRRPADRRRAAPHRHLRVDISHRRLFRRSRGFLDIVPIRFSIAEPEGHYHVPLLVTPWSYTTYRGS